MAMKKHGTGEVLATPSMKAEAASAPEWTDDDAAALAEENEDEVEQPGSSEG